MFQEILYFALVHFQFDLFKFDWSRCRVSKCTAYTVNKIPLKKYYI